MEYKMKVTIGSFNIYSIKDKLWILNYLNKTSTFQEADRSTAVQCEYFLTVCVRRVRSIINSLNVHDQ